MTQADDNGATPSPPTTMSDVVTQWGRHEALVAQLQPANKAALLRALAKAGIARVIMYFDGAGDSGQFESIDAFDAMNGTVILPDVPVEILQVRWNADCATPVILPLAQALETHAYALLGSAHPGWENNDGAYGEFTFDVPSGTILLDHSARYTETEEFSHSF